MQEYFPLHADSIDLLNIYFKIFANWLLLQYLNI